MKTMDWILVGAVIVVLMLIAAGASAPPPAPPPVVNNTTAPPPEPPPVPPPNQFIVEPATPTGFTGQANFMQNANFLSDLSSYGWITGEAPEYSTDGAVDIGSLVIEHPKSRFFWQTFDNRVPALKAGDKLLLRYAIKAESGYTGSGGKMSIQLKKHWSTGDYAVKKYINGITLKSASYTFVDVPYTVTSTDEVNGWTYLVVSFDSGTADVGRVHIDNIRLYFVRP